VGPPGTGLSWREYQHKPARHQCNLCAAGRAHVPPWLVAALLVLAAVLLVLKLKL
jgi:hypothetical protein